MNGFTRRSLVAAVGVGLASAGCLSDAGGPGSEEETTGDWIAQASNSPDPSHEIRVESDLSESRTLRVAVVREATGETVFETTEEFSGGEHTLYNLEAADPDGVERFRVCAELVEERATATESASAVGNATATVGPTATTASEVTTTDAEEVGTASPRRDCATIETSECYGNAYVALRDDESVQIIYAIC